MFIGLLDTDVQMTDFYSVQMTIISGPQRGKIKIVALGGFGVCVYTVTHGRQVCMCLWMEPFGPFQVLIIMVLTTEYLIDI